ncbi:MAG: hypothetical protein NVSMB66_4190 [Candidatus Doudnabacteria bacterium]
MPTTSPKGKRELPNQSNREVKRWCNEAFFRRLKEPSQTFMLQARSPKQNQWHNVYSHSTTEVKAEERGMAILVKEESLPKSERLEYRLFNLIDPKNRLRRNRILRLPAN